MFPQNRDALLQYLEKFYGLLLLTNIVPPLAAYFLVGYLYGHAMFDILYFSLLVVFSLLIAACLLYLALVAYIKIHAHIAWATFFGVVITLLAFPVVFIIRHFWVEQKEQVIFCALPICCFILIIIFLLRHWAKKIWQQVDFMRIKI